MKLRIANKIIDNFDCENPRYRETTLGRAVRRYEACRTGRERKAWWQAMATVLREYKRLAPPSPTPQ